MNANGDERILLYDLEISPILAWVYDMYDANVIAVERPKYIMSFAYKWMGEPDIHVLAQPDYDRYRRDKYNDKSVVDALWDVLDEADIVVAHNASAFDNKVAMARFMYHGLTPPSPFKTVDTLTVARRTFKFGANSLAFLCEQLNIGSKSTVKHHDLWHRCVDGDMEAWALLKEYNKRDVEMLDELYAMLLPYMSNHPVVSASGCPKCGSSFVQYRGVQRSKTNTYRRVHCQQCGAWSRERKCIPGTVQPQFV